MNHYLSNTFPEMTPEEEKCFFRHQGIWTLSHFDENVNCQVARVHASVEAFLDYAGWPDERREEIYYALYDAGSFAATDTKGRHLSIYR